MRALRCVGTGPRHGARCRSRHDRPDLPQQECLCERVELKRVDSKLAKRPLLVFQVVRVNDPDFRCAVCERRSLDASGSDDVLCGNAEVIDRVLDPRFEAYLVGVPQCALCKISSLPGERFEDRLLVRGGT